MSVEKDAKGFTSACMVSSLPEPKKVDPLLSPDYEIRHTEKISVVKFDNENVQLFVERRQYLQDPFEYTRNGDDPGLVLIFNQESFENMAYRSGSRRDVNEIINCMSRLGFNINENYIFNDYTRENILKIIDKITEQDLSNYNSLIVFFLTHGDNFNVLHAQDYSLKTHEIWEKFAKCDHLKNKPKMFIFQACKGESSSTIADTNKEEIELVPEKTFESNFIGPDMLIVYSTTEGNVSFRDPKIGTWFIQELCKNFLAYGRRDDVISLIMRTTKCLCRNYYYNEGDKIKKQMPIFISTLRQKFYLNRTKERNVLIKLIQDQEAIKLKIAELEQKVNELVQEKDKKSN